MTLHSNTDTLVLATDYVQASAVKTVHTAHHWLGEHSGFRFVRKRRTHSKLVRPQLQIKSNQIIFILSRLSI